MKHAQIDSATYRRWRKFTGKTQTKIAQEVGIFESQLAAFANGRMALTEHWSPKLRRVLVASMKQHLADVQEVLDEVR